MSTTATTQLPPGIYRIVVADGDLESQRLTYGENYVTVLPSGANNDAQQEWRIERSEDDTIVISRASRFFPLPYLTYDARGKPGPKAGDRIVVKIAPVPLNKWRFKFLQNFKAIIQVDGSDLGIAIAPPKIFPPFLELSVEDQLEWRFEFVRPE